MSTATRTTPQRAVFWQTLSTLIGNGVSLLEAWQVAASQSEVQTISEITAKVIEAIATGQMLGEIMAVSDIFSAFEINYPLSRKPRRSATGPSEPRESSAG